MEEGHLLGEGCVVFAFEGLQQQRELGGFDGLTVNVNAVDVGGEDALRSAIVRWVSPLAF